MSNEDPVQEGFGGTRPNRPLPDLGSDVDESADPGMVMPSVEVHQEFANIASGGLSPPVDSGMVIPPVEDAVQETEENTPGGLVLPAGATTEPRRLATPEETQQDVEGIASEERTANAGAALKELAMRIIEVVTEVDHSYNLANYLQYLKITCAGPGDFRLDIADKNSEIDPEQIALEVARALDEKGGDYGKNLRPIQMETPNDVRETTGPDGDVAEGVSGGDGAS